MDDVHLFNNIAVGGPAIILQLSHRGDAIIPAEGDGAGGLIPGAVGVITTADKAYLEARALETPGLVVQDVA